MKRERTEPTGELPVPGTEVDTGPEYAAILGVRPPECAYTDAYRAFRAAFLALSEREPFCRVLVTSPQPAEGKTSVAVNLASTLARAQKRVLLIDADFRRPSLHNLLSVPVSTPGLVDACRGHMDPLAIVRETSLAGLSVVVAGHDTADASDVPGLPRTSAVLAQLAETHDYLIIDSAPLLAHAAALELAGSVDAVLLVARARGHAAVVRRAISVLNSIGARLLGVVVNDILPEDQAVDGLPYYYTREKGVEDNPMG